MRSDYEKYSNYDLSILSDIERKVLLRYLSGETQKEIAESLNYRSVCHILKRVSEKLENGTEKENKK